MKGELYFGLEVTLQKKVSQAELELLRSLSSSAFVQTVWAL